MTFEDKLTELEKKSELIKGELEKNGIKNPEKFLTNPEAVIKWMNAVEEKIAVKSDIAESLNLAVSTLVQIDNETTPPDQYVDSLRIALFQVTAALVNVVEILKKKGIL